jgi:hypothetical protein
MESITRNRSKKKKIFIDLSRNLDYESDYCDNIPIEYSEDEFEEESGCLSDTVVIKKNKKDK